MPYCPKCGTSVGPAAQFCPNCGSAIPAVASSPPPPTSSAPVTTPPASSYYGTPMSNQPTYGAARMQRPTGVTILSVLEVIGGIALLLGGVGLTFVGAFVDPTGLLAALGVVLLLLGVACFVVAFGLWNGTIAFALSILSIITSAVSIVGSLGSSILGLLVSLVIIYYLTRPYVRAYFGKARTVTI